MNQTETSTDAPITMVKTYEVIVPQGHIGTRPPTLAQEKSTAPNKPVAGMTEMVRAMHRREFDWILVPLDWNDDGAQGTAHRAQCAAHSAAAALEFRVKTYRSVHGLVIYPEGDARAGGGR